MSGASKIDLGAVDAGEIAAAAGAVIVGGDDEFRCRIDRLAIEHQVDDAAGAAVDQLALGIVFRAGLRDIDPVGDAVDHVEIVGREVGLISVWSALPGSTWLKMPADISSHSFTCAPVIATARTVFG